MTSNPNSSFPLPANLPVPTDDGGCDHLPGMALPRLLLVSTAGRPIDLSAERGTWVVYCYPRTGRPGEALPVGWDEIPGARGCTPQSCAFKDHYQELRSLDAQVVGISTQSTDYQREVAERLHLPFPLLSDDQHLFTEALRLPTLEVEGMTLIKRLTLVIRSGRIAHVFYPVFPPDKNAQEVVDWIRNNPSH